jgi:hypothetical protein
MRLGCIKSLCSLGDFNLVMSQKDKRNGVVDVKWCEKYNDWIDKNNLIEIKLLGRGFTWSNNQEHAVIYRQGFL